VTATGLPSLDVVAATAVTEREKQLTHFDALDAKASVLVGFAGVLVALVQGLPSWSSIGAVALASSSALAAVTAFWPRALPALDVMELRRYLAAEPAFTKLTLFDTMSEMVEQGAVVLARKARNLKVAMVLLGAALTVVSAGVVTRSLG
jgi:hypothetical protein